MRKIFYTFLLIFVGFLWIFFIKIFSQKNVITYRSPEKNLVQIIAKNQNNEIISRSTGWKIYDKTVITALHNVENDQYFYTINNEIYNIIFRDEIRDLAIISIWNEMVDENIFEKIFTEAKVGKDVFIVVWMDGKIEKKSAKILAIDSEISAIGMGWNVKKIVPKVLTDAEVRVGDSGSPVWNECGELVGLVHISK